MYFSKMSVLSALFKNLSLVTLDISLKRTQTFVIPLRYKVRVRTVFKELPKPGDKQAFRRIIHYPEEYTIKPLNTSHLGGRDPVTGRRIVKTIGGGLKHKYHWIKWERDGPSEGPPQEEKVLQIIKCGCRTANVALVAVQDKLKYILATENMKAGDIIKTSKFIPRNPVRPNEGDAYPLGALPLGTYIHNVQLHPTHNYTFVHSAGSFAILKKHLNGKVIVQLPSKKEIGFEPECMATVGRVSNVEHSSIPIGSPQKLRELGYRPRSGLWQRKTGRFGRKIRSLPPVEFFSPKPKEREEIRCTLPHIKI